MKITYAMLLARILRSPCASGWLQNAAVALEKRDCVDAYQDALALTSLAKRRMDEALKGNG